MHSELLRITAEEVYVTASSLKLPNSNMEPIFPTLLIKAGEMVVYYSIHCDAFIFKAKVLKLRWILGVSPHSVF
jgi:hypothetical protein